MAMQDVYDLFHDINGLLVGRGLQRLEDMLRPAAMSGMVSDLLTASLANHSRTLIENKYFNGHPDLLVEGAYPNDAAQAGTEGIEIKSTLKAGGAVDTHGARDQWLCVFVYVVDHQNGTRPRAAADGVQGSLSRPCAYGRFPEQRSGHVRHTDGHLASRGPAKAAGALDLPRSLSVCRDTRGASDKQVHIAGALCGVACALAVRNPRGWPARMWGSVYPELHQPRDRRSGHLEIAWVFLHADACVAHCFRRGQRGAGAAEGIQHDTFAKGQHTPH